MARFLFVSLPLTGHADWGGMLAMAGALAARPAHQVAWASGPPLAPATERAGVPFLPLDHTGWRDQPPELPAGAPSSARRERALDAWLNRDRVLAAVASLDAAIAAWQPDALVVEPYAAAGALAAEKNRLPMVVAGRPALPSGDLPAAGPAAGRIGNLCRAAGVDGHYWDSGAGQIRSPWLHIDFFTPRWYADLPGIGDQTRFFGAAAPVRPPAEVPPDLVLITLGSLFIDDPAFFRIAAEAVLAEGGQPLVVTGRRTADGATAGAPGRLPAWVETTNWVDFDALLPGAAGIIHHGGVGTTHAALRHGAPQVAVPHAGDQHAQAGRITQAGVGYGVRPSDFTPSNARWFARQLLANGALRDQARRWQQELLALGGPDSAADALETDSRIPFPPVS